MNTLTTQIPETVEPHVIAATITTPDGVYEVVHFRTGQVVAGKTFWWAARHQGDYYAEVFTTSLEEAMAWLGRRLCETCF